MRHLLILSLGLLLITAAAAAGIDGTWVFSFQTDGGERPMTITLKADGSEISGATADEAEVKGTFTDGVLSLSFPYYAPDAGFEAEVKIKGTLEDNKISGDWTFSEFGGQFTAARQ